MPDVMTVVVRYFAAARAAAGVDEEKLQVATGATIGDLLDVVRAEHGAELSRVLDRCSYLLDEVAARDLTAVLHEGATLDVLPPFAGG
jgi:molybdopterin converting factor small subunit